MNKTKEQLAQEHADTHYRAENIQEKQDAIDDYIAGYESGFEAAEPKWISVKIDLPPHDMEVIGYFPTGNEGGKKVAMAHLVDEKVVSNFPNSTAIYFVATHWMPLPNPPKNERKNF